MLGRGLAFKAWDPAEDEDDDEGEDENGDKDAVLVEVGPNSEIEVG